MYFVLLSLLLAVENLEMRILSLDRSTSFCNKEINMKVVLFVCFSLNPSEYK